MHAIKGQVWPMKSHVQVWLTHEKANYYIFITNGLNLKLLDVIQSDVYLGLKSFAIVNTYVACIHKNWHWNEYH